MIDLSVVIVNHNSGEFLRGCLSSLRLALSPPSAEIVVVDNASRNGSVCHLPAEFPQVGFLANSHNLGYARACNQGIERTSGRYVVLLNPDTLVPPPTLGEMVAFMDLHPDVGIAGVRHSDPQGRLQPVCRSFPDYLSLLAGRESLITKLFPGNPLSRRFLLDDLDYTAPQEVDFPGGACLMLRRSMLEEIGLLDEEYFLYPADTDICFRAKQRGWRIYFLPQTGIVHFWGQSTRRQKGRAFLAHHKGLYRFFHKHRHPSPLTRTLFIGGATLRVGGLMFREVFSDRPPPE